MRPSEFLLVLDTHPDRVTELPALPGSTVRALPGLAWRAIAPDIPSPLDFHHVIDTDDLLILTAGTLYHASMAAGVAPQLEQLCRDLPHCGDGAIGRLLLSLTGHFCGVLWNRRAQQGIAFTDRCSVQKLFHAQQGGMTILSSRLMDWMAPPLAPPAFSTTAFSSIIHASWTFTDETVLEGVRQIQPAHFMAFDTTSVRVVDYERYPERQRMSLQESVALLDATHRGFWRTAGIREEEICLFMSKGKDSRIMLKGMLDAGVHPHLLTFYRKDNPLAPFVSFLTDFEGDSFASQSLAERNGISFERHRIPNHYLLEHLTDIVDLNHGTPLHWEFKAAAALVEGRHPYVVTGYNGHVFSGRNEHHDQFIVTLKNAEAYGRFKFEEAGHARSYATMAALLARHGVATLLPREELEHLWLAQYATIRSDDLDVISAIGQVRTRGIGREIGTFHQIRRHAVPIYPYNDAAVCDAYLTIPNAHMKGQRAHLGLVAFDPRFNFIETGKLSLPATWEARLLGPMWTLRKLYKLRTRFRSERPLSPDRRTALAEAIFGTLEGFGTLPPAFVADLRAAEDGTFGFFQTAANLITALRISAVFTPRPGVHP